MHISPSARLLALVCILVMTSSHADPLQRPAQISRLASERLITSLAPVGANQLIAIGQRGHILLSSNAGTTWTQAPNPVSSDLTAVQFLDSRRGYAVGHDGIVLGSMDGGDNWSVLLDGKKANTLVLEQLKNAPPKEERQRLLAEAERNVANGPDKPWLDLYFSSPQEGFVVGAYNLILETHDGGKSWHSWFDRSDNRDKLFNLYSIRPHKGQLFIAGEAGTLMRLDPTRQRFVKLDTGYQGSFFGLLDAGESLIAYGMRGQARISRDAGKTWENLASGLQASITAAARGDDGRLWLADQVGNVSVSADDGQRFTPMKLPFSMPVAALQVTSGALVLAGPRGVRSIPLPKE